MSLADLVQVVLPDEQPEDIFHTALGSIFPDDLRNFHGDPDAIVVYRSKRFGNIELQAAQPDREDDRRLFAHYLWNAGIRMAELISEEDDPTWRVRGTNVLELGAGVGLNGVVAILAGAALVVISDYPSRPVLDNIRHNAVHSVEESLRSKYRVQGHIWGDLESEFASQNKNRFGRILAADCYWIPHEHENLVHSMLHFLDLSTDARVFAIAGFHTGRANLAAFFETAGLMGLDTEEIYEEDADGNRREWLRERDGGIEDQSERKKWLVIARLMRRL